MVDHAVTAAQRLQEQGVSCAVIDPRTTSPLDEDTILESVAATGRLVVIDEANPRCSIAADVAALVAEKVFDSLQAPIRRVTAPHCHVPFAPELEDAYLPNAEKIEAAVLEISGVRRG